MINKELEEVIRAVKEEAHQKEFIENINKNPTSIKKSKSLIKWVILRGSILWMMIQNFIKGWLISYGVAYSMERGGGIPFFYINKTELHTR